MLIPLALGSLFSATSFNFLPSLPSNNFFILFITFGLLVSIGGLWLTNKNKQGVSFFVFLLGMVLSFGWGYLQAAKRLEWHLPQEDSQSSIPIKARVEGITLRSKEGMRFDGVLLSYKGKKLNSAYPVKVRLFWAHPKYKLLHGDIIQGVVKLKQPWHMANPGSFDQEKQFFIEGIRAQGKVLAINNYIPGKGFSLFLLRQKMAEKMSQYLKDKPLLGVIQAMTLGISSGITPSQWQVFQGTGTSHLIAISGQQVALVAMFCFYLVAFLVRRFHRLTSLYPDKYYGAIAAIIGAFVYSGLAGFSIPTQRALIMIVLAMWAILQNKPLLTWQRFACAWLIMAIFDPLAPMQLGFWLSFGCVAALVYARHHMAGNKWRQWVLPQGIVFIALLPVSLVIFHQTALYSPLANLITLPIMSFIVVPGSLCCLALMPLSHTLSNGVLSVVHFSLSGVWALLEKITQLPLYMLQLGEISFTSLISASVGALFLLAPKGIPGRHFGWFALLPLFLQPGKLITYGDYRFTLLDVGQGLSAVIQTQNHTLLFDAGPQYGTASDAGQRVIKPFLNANYIRSLDKVIISHSDLDHRGGLKGLADFPKKEILTSEPERLTFSAKQCMAGQSWEWDGVDFKILGPSTLNTKKRNDLSCVLKVSNGAHSVLLSGDIEKGAERKLIKEYKEELKSSILVVPHHGSKTSSTDNFINYVAPLYALFPVGLGNHYGFPKAEILSRYEKKGTINLVSWQTGAISFQVPLEGELLPPKSYRLVSKRFWFS